MFELTDLGPVFFVNFAMGPAGVAESDGICGNVPGHHGTCADDTVVTNGHTGENRNAGAYPDVVSDVDGQSPFQPPVPLFGIDGVRSRREAAVGCDKDVVAEGDFCRIQDDAVMVDVEGITCGNIIPVIADERLFDDGILPQFAENFSEGHLAAFEIAGSNVVVIEAKFLAPGTLLDEVWIVVGVVKFAGQHFFLLCHLKILLIFCSIYNF